MTGSCYCLDTYRSGDMEGAANINVITCSRLWGLMDGTGGLVGLNERAKLLGGHLSLQTSPGEGTRLSVTVPL